MCGLVVKDLKVFTFETDIDLKKIKIIDNGVCQYNLAKKEIFQTDYIEHIEEITDKIQQKLPKGIVLRVFVKDPENEDFYLIFDKDDYMWIDLFSNRISLKYDTPSAEENKYLQEAIIKTLKEIKEETLEFINSVEKTEKKLEKNKNK